MDNVPEADDDAAAGPEPKPLKPSDDGVESCCVVKDGAKLIFAGVLACWGAGAGENGAGAAAGAAAGAPN